ncbi:glycosyltransferase family 4 protein [Mariniflexile ostreae]|uniref:Glycosyltransferase family 4 protein n=1 Tax=Mariniflexile ostreae TaxID=1520892 RepID=A0ABV5FDU4_9FLAO
MTIVYYTDQIHMHGGLERVMANKLNYLSEHTKASLHVVTFQQEENLPCYPLPDTVNLHDLEIPYNRAVSFLHPSNIKYAYTHYKRLKKVLKTINPDVVVVCNYEYGFYFIPFLAKKKNIIKEYHSSRYFYNLKRQQNTNIIKKILYKVTDYFEAKYNHIVVLTSDELNYYKSENKLVIPNAITHFNSKTANLTNKKAISAGRIAPVKGFENLIWAWQEVAKRQPDWVLEIYGDGEVDYIDKLKAQISKLNLNNHVYFKGATNNLEEKILESSIYVMSSHTECFPMVLLEAQACGVPIVSFDCPNGPRHIINHEVDGLLVEKENIQMLAENTLKLINNEKTRMIYGKQGKINVQRFSEEKIMPIWLNIFKNN